MQMHVLCLVAFLFCCTIGASENLYEKSIFQEPNDYLKKLSQITDIPGSIARTFFSDAHKASARQLEAWMGEAGMLTYIDLVGNVHGVINSSNPELPVVILGSHYDTVIDGGAYDGALGIIAGVSAVKTMLLAELEAAGQLDKAKVNAEGRLEFSPAQANAFIRTPIHLVAFADEEGVRFQSTFLGSRALAGTLLKYKMLGAHDKTGASLGEVLAMTAGLAADDVPAAAAALSLGRPIAEYVEVHMEQGPVLERSGLPLGVVSAIAGQSRLWVAVSGEQGHAGTVPMRGRVDALAAAAEMMVALEALCARAEAEGGAPESEQLVCTVGELRVWPGASNVIPGRAEFSVDIRCKSDPLRAKIVQEATDGMTAIAERRSAGCRIDRRHDAAAVASDAGVIGILSEAARGSESLLLRARSAAELAAIGLSGAALQQTPVLVSGAGHDAMAMAEVTKMAMMFVRCRAGISHSPLEHVDPADVSASVAALARYLQIRAGGGASAPRDEL